MKYLLIVILITHNILICQHDTSIVRLDSIDSTIVMDVKYATTNNFTGQKLYNTNIVYIRKIVGDSLSRANYYLIKEYNLRIKIFDGYRPLSVQKLMWEIVPDDRYVANPVKGSKHNRGAAVDITLIDTLGNEVPMGTEYDDFTEKAHFNYGNLKDEVKYNRDLLRNVMKKFGFEPISSEWWHFDFNGWQRFSILDYEIN
ncbi:M15 family metallopeptidase [Bacteroidota bacterium]